MLHRDPVAFFLYIMPVQRTHNLVEILHKDDIWTTGHSAILLPLANAFGRHRAQAQNLTQYLSLKGIIKILVMRFIFHVMQG